MGASDAANTGAQAASDDVQKVVIEGKRLSGPKWASRFPGSQSLDDLNQDFGPHARSFVDAIHDAGGGTRISATYRPRERAYLMHYSYLVGNGDVQPKDVPGMDGVNIDWVHDTDKESVQAAAALAKAFDIVYAPALISRHTEGAAVDMTITGIIGKDMVNGAGKTVRINNKSDLNGVGSSYGVYKLNSDPPHWSDDGH